MWFTELKGPHPQCLILQLSYILAYTRTNSKSVVMLNYYYCGESSLQSCDSSNWGDLGTSHRISGKAVFHLCYFIPSEVTPVSFQIAFSFSFIIFDYNTLL